MVAFFGFNSVTTNLELGIRHLRFKKRNTITIFSLLSVESNHIVIAYSNGCNFVVTCMCSSAEIIAKSFPLGQPGGI